MAVIVLIVVMDITIINVALNPIQLSLGASNAELQWSLDTYLITFAAFIFTGGVCADRFGRKKVLVAGLLIFGIASTLAAYAADVESLILWRAVMGVGAAVIPTVTLAVIMATFPPPERPKAIATWAAAAGVAFAVGPILGGVLLESFWWGSIFLINAPLVLISVVLIALWVPESRSPMKSRFDPLGVVLSIVAIGLLVYGIVVGGEDNEWLSLPVLGSIVAGLALIAVLVLVESRMASPSLDVKLLRSSRFSAGTATIALCFFALIGAIFVIQFYYQAVRGYSPMQAGLLMLPMGVGTVLTSARSPKLAARFGPRTVVAAGAVVMALSFVLTAVMDRQTGVWLLIVAQLLFGIGWGCIMAPATGSLMSVVPLPKAGAGQAVTQTARQVAGALGVAVIGSVLGSVYRSSLGDAVDVLPAGLRDEAGDSIGGTLRAIASAGLPDGGASLVDAGMQAYLTGMRAAMIVAIVVVLAAAVISLRWLPKQLPPPPMPPAPPAPPATSADQPQSVAAKPVG
ncbi:MFS transporter [Micromonospora sp. NPDC002389]|uniref:MFS transporter n=1 Tax=Micromonospora sp. NPDC002389 TaxID=3154272 RepID=UPI0033232178